MLPSIESKFKFENNPADNGHEKPVPKIDSPDPFHIRFDSQIYEQLYDEPFIYDNKYQQFEDKLFEDGDLVNDSDFLEAISALSPAQRVVLLTQSAKKVYTSPNDYEQYFVRFPEDAKSVIAVCLDKIDIGNMPDYTIHQLSCKVFEAAAKTIPEYWQRFKEAVDREHHTTRNDQWPLYLTVSERSKRARERLLGDFKTLPQARFEQFGHDLFITLDKFLAYVEDVRNLQEWGIVDIENSIFHRHSYQQLPPQTKADFLQNLIIYCHNAVVFHEVYNSYQSEEQAIAKPDKITIGMDENGNFKDKIVGRGHHSIIYNTDHKENAFQLPEYDDFEVNQWNVDRSADENGYEKIIERCIHEIGNVGSPDNIKPILDFWDKNRDPTYGPTISTTLSKIDPSLSAGATLERIEHASELDKKRLLSLLFRLELGKVGISDQGLEYLGRRFDLGEHNDPTNFVQRITADGKVGVFDAEKRLEGFVQLEADDFSQASGDQENAIRKEIIAIASEMLFTPKADDTEEDEANRQTLLKHFIENYYDTYIIGFNQRTGVLFNNLSLQEQGWALSYLNSADEEKKDKFYDLVKSHGENALTTFVAIEYGSQFGDQIIELAETLDKEQAENFFRSFSNISDSARELSQLFAEISERSKLNLEYIRTQIFEAIIRKTTNFIIAAKESVSNPDNINFNEILNAMNEFRFVLSEIIEAIQLKGDKYLVAEKQYHSQEDTTNYVLKDKKQNYQINLVIRPQETQTTIKDKQTGETKTILLHPGIRTTFIWPDKKKFGIRLDLDPHYKDQEFPNGRLSLDIGSPESRIAQILDITSYHGHHNVMSFSPELSDPKIFDQLCTGFRNYLDQMMELATPS